MTNPFPFQENDDFSRWVQARLAGAASMARTSGSENSFALQSDTLALLREILIHARPSRAAEFGGGSSTAIFADWQREVRGFSFCTFEHDYDWARELASKHPDGDIVHAPLRLNRDGARCFLTYKGLERLRSRFEGCQLYLLDGPHAAGRESVLFAVLNACQPGAMVLIDDLKLDFVRTMLEGVPRATAQCFSGFAVEENSHGLYLLRCEKPVVTSSPPWLGVRASARSMWRCLRDVAHYGTGDRWVQDARRRAISSAGSHTRRDTIP